MIFLFKFSSSYDLAGDEAYYIHREANGRGSAVDRVDKPRPRRTPFNIEYNI